MTDAPERIWATAYYNQNRNEHVKEWSACGFDDLQQVQYVRADLTPDVTQAVKAALDAAAKVAAEAWDDQWANVPARIRAIDPATIIAALAEGRG